MPLAERYAHVKAGIPPNVTLVAVSKTRSVAEIQSLYDLGQRHFGENYPQELREKQPVLPHDIAWHFIGHLQRSNVKHIVPFVHLIHGVESERLLEEIQKRALAEGRSVDVLLQVFIAQEETKHGLSPAELRSALKTWPWAAWPNVRVRGVMGMATNTEDRSQVQGEFESLAALWAELRSTEVFPRDQFTELSMGMSGDVDLAIAAGSTMVRVGTAIFGAR
ncbi:MAG: YggS family pyridoxal phosphate-dependent enzyme [Flavobacteriales bacterium]|nr:YggS family pyridoxal phosphate-dependent enzyme [Flavobacteriales bacterium]MBK9288769.1 YggS family pyridoxal phosphate-dependent enzyme [Flavobacteriales bacterium]